MAKYVPDHYIVRHADGSPLPEDAKFFIVRFDKLAPFGKAARSAMFTFAAAIKGKGATAIYQLITGVEKELERDEQS